MKNNNTLASSSEQYIEKIKPCQNIKSNFKKSVTWIIQLLAEINFISSFNVDGEQLMYSYSENIEIMINEKEGIVIKKPFGSVPSKYQNSREKSIKVIRCIFDCVNSLRYRCH